MESEHARLSYAIHSEAQSWTSAMKKVTDDTLQDYYNTFESYDDEPRIRVWKRIVLREAHRRGLDLSS